MRVAGETPPGHRPAPFGQGCWPGQFAIPSLLLFLLPWHHFFTGPGRTCLRLSRGHFDVLILRHFVCFNAISWQDWWD